MADEPRASLEQTSRDPRRTSGTTSDAQIFIRQVHRDDPSPQCTSPTSGNWLSDRSS